MSNAHAQSAELRSPAYQESGQPSRTWWPPSSQFVVPRQPVSSGTTHPPTQPPSTLDTRTASVATSHPSAAPQPDPFTVNLPNHLNATWTPQNSSTAPVQQVRQQYQPLLSAAPQPTPFPVILPNNLGATWTPQNSGTAQVQQGRQQYQPLLSAAPQPIPFPVNLPNNLGTTWTPQNSSTAPVHQVQQQYQPLQPYTPLASANRMLSADVEQQVSQPAPNLLLGNLASYGQFLWHGAQVIVDQHPSLETLSEQSASNGAQQHIVHHASREVLLSMFPAIHAEERADHMTIIHRPSVRQVLSLPLGLEVQLEVEGIAADHRAQAAAVKAPTSILPPLTSCSHITISLATGVSAKEAGKLVTDGLVGSNTCYHGIEMGDRFIVSGHVAVRLSDYSSVTSFQELITLGVISLPRRLMEEGVLPLPAGDCWKLPDATSTATPEQGGTKPSDKGGDSSSKAPLKGTTQAVLSIKAGTPVLAVAKSALVPKPLAKAPPPASFDAQLFPSLASAAVPSGGKKGGKKSKGGTVPLGDFLSKGVPLPAVNPADEDDELAFRGAKVRAGTTMGRTASEQQLSPESSVPSPHERVHWLREVQLGALVDVAPLASSTEGGSGGAVAGQVAEILEEFDFFQPLGVLVRLSDDSIGHVVRVLKGGEGGGLDPGGEGLGQDVDPALLAEWEQLRESFGKAIADGVLEDCGGKLEQATVVLKVCELPMVIRIAIADGVLEDCGGKLERATVVLKAQAELSANALFSFIAKTVNKVETAADAAQALAMAQAELSADALFSLIAKTVNKVETAADAAAAQALAMAQAELSADALFSLIAKTVNKVETAADAAAAQALAMAQAEAEADARAATEAEFGGPGAGRQGGRGRGGRGGHRAGSSSGGGWGQSMGRAPGAVAGGGDQKVGHGIGETGWKEAASRQPLPPRHENPVAKPSPIMLLKKPDSLATQAANAGVNIRMAESLSSMLPGLATQAANAGVNIRMAESLSSMLPGAVVAALRDTKGDINEAAAVLLASGPPSQPAVAAATGRGGSRSSSETGGSTGPSSPKLAAQSGAGRQPGMGVSVSPAMMSEAERLNSLSLEDKITKATEAFKGLDRGLAEYALRECDADLPSTFQYLSDSLDALVLPGSGPQGMGSTLAKAPPRTPSYKTMAAAKAAAADDEEDAQEAKPARASIAKPAAQHQEQWQDMRRKERRQRRQDDPTGSKLIASLEADKARQVTEVYYAARNVFYQQARICHDAGAGKRAAEYSHRGKEMGDLAKKYRWAMNERAFQSSNTAIRNEYCMDLHQMYVDEALEMMRRTLTILSALPNPEGVWLKVITGAGRHSVNGIPVIKQGVLAYLKEAGLKYQLDDFNQGVQARLNHGTVHMVAAHGGSALQVEQHMVAAHGGLALQVEQHMVAAHGGLALQVEHLMVAAHDSLAL
eukprot:gene14843-20897_t